jgi:6-phosphogluconolactonase (cycloisomerase 2 family)
MSSRIHRTAAVIAMVAPLTGLAFAGTASASGGDHGHDGHRSAGTIYTETNSPLGNAVLAFRDVGGALVAAGSFDTGGLGSGSGLGSQGALVADGDHLLAVNAGSNEVSLFSIERDGSLELEDVESSGGVTPVSVTVHDDVAYVVNAGDGTVSGFRIRHDDLRPIAGSTQTLPGRGAAQISFDQRGRRLVVTEKGTDTIDVLPVNRRGVAGAAVSNPSTGQTPFGFAIDRRNHVIVSNAAGGAAGASSVSSYRFDGRAGLTPVSSAVATTQSAACWIALSGNQKFAYTTNTASGSISSYRVSGNGGLTLVSAVATTPGAGPLDMVEAGGALFTLNNGSHTISTHSIGNDGSLTASGAVAVPAGVVGLAAG